jgi:hypothetical protein
MIETLRWLLGKAVAVFGDGPVGELPPVAAHIQNRHRV